MFKFIDIQHLNAKLMLTKTQASFAMDFQTRKELLKLYHQNGENVTSCIRAYNRLHNVKKCRFSYNAIKKLIARFDETGSVMDRPITGRPSVLQNCIEDVDLTLRHHQTDSPLGATSTRRISDEIELSQSSVWRILRHHLRLHPYKLQLCQAISETDKISRLEFSDHIRSLSPTQLGNILWTDEAIFRLDGVVNRHNCIVWGTERPHPVSQSLHANQVSVWMGFSKELKLTPYFFEGTVTGDSYLKMLHTHVIPQLQSSGKMNDITFQQDGAPPHFAKKVSEFLKEVFGDRVIARGFPTRWPPRSPDLSPLDFYLWGTLKNRVYHHGRPGSMEELKSRITNEVALLNQSELINAISDVLYRAELLVEVNGDVFEYSK